MRSRSPMNAKGQLVPIMSRAARLAALAGALFLAASAAHATCGLPGDYCAETGDQFGNAVARGDFNGDGFEDLAIGVLGENIGSLVDAGAVEVIYGTASGLGFSNRQFWSQDSPNIEDVAEGTTPPQDLEGDVFGSSLAAGDFNGDGFDDLAIGVWGENVGSVINAGAVNVIHGSPTGLSATFIPDQFWTQDSPNVDGMAEQADFFGVALAAGDFNGDGRDDLAMGVPGEDIGSLSEAGAVNVLYGSSTGLSATSIPDQLWAQDSPGVEGDPESNDVFGYSLAAGDFNGDGRDDLAIGVHREDIGSIALAGAVNVLYGSPTGLSATFVPDQLWSQDSANVEDVAENGDLFGISLAAGDFNGAGPDDLAIGASGEDIGSMADAGAVNVLYGSTIGLSATSVPDQLWSQNSANVEDVAETNDLFGASLTAGDFNGDGRDDLAVGSDEDISSIVNAGVANVIYGSSTGLNAVFVPDQLWSQNSANVEDLAEPSDDFGTWVAAGDFNGDGRDDLAVGVPGEDLNDVNGAISGAGAANVIYGASTGLSATAVPDQFWSQTYTLPPQP